MKNNLKKNLWLVFISLATFIMGCATFGTQKKNTATLPPPPPPDPAEIINSPEFIAKNGYVVRHVPYPPARTLTLKEKIDEADIVVEAKAVVEREFNRTSADSVRTAYLLVVYKVFKGNVKTDTIELTVKGGSYDEVITEEELIPGTGIYSSLAGKKVTMLEDGKTFGTNQYGVFFLKKNPNPVEQYAFKQIPNKYKFIAQWHRNYLWYNDWNVTEQSLKDTDPVWYYTDKNPLTRLYNSIQKITGKKYKERVPLYSKKKNDTGQTNKKNSVLKNRVMLI